MARACRRGCRDARAQGVQPRAHQLPRRVSGSHRRFTLTRRGRWAVAQERICVKAALSGIADGDAAHVCAEEQMSKLDSGEKGKQIAEREYRIKTVEIHQLTSMVRECEDELERLLTIRVEEVAALNRALDDAEARYQAETRARVAAYDAQVAQLEANLMARHTTLEKTRAATPHSAGFFYSRSLPPSAPASRTASKAYQKWQRIKQVPSPRPGERRPASDARVVPPREADTFKAAFVLPVDFNSRRALLRMEVRSDLRGHSLRRFGMLGGKVDPKRDGDSLATAAREAREQSNDRLAGSVDKSLRAGRVWNEVVYNKTRAVAYLVECNESDLHDEQRDRGDDMAIEPLHQQELRWVNVPDVRSSAWRERNMHFDAAILCARLMKW